MKSWSDVSATTTRRLGLRPGTAEAGQVHDAVREFQASVGLPVTGELTPATEAALAARAIDNPVPVWFGTSRQDDTVAARIGPGEDAVRRYQSAAGLPVTGVVDEATARLLGD